MRALLLLTMLASPAAAGDMTPALTPGHVQAIFAAKGANPGAVFIFGNAGRYVLRSLTVSGGANGEFDIRVKVDKVKVYVGR